MSLKIQMIIDEAGTRDLPPGWYVRATLEQFYWEVGADKMKSAYDWEDPIFVLKHGQTLLVLLSHGESEWVAWAILTPEVRDHDHQSLTLGIRPKFQGRGYRKELLILVSDWAFQHNAAEYVTTEIYDSNYEQVRKYMRDEAAGFPFKYSGRIWIPEGISLFTRLKPEGVRHEDVPVSVQEHDRAEPKPAAQQAGSSSSGESWQTRTTPALLEPCHNRTS